MLEKILCIRKIMKQPLTTKEMREYVLQKKEKLVEP